eukprot:scaffold225539_cov27-Tisochrysis_lutea.AAC.3
MALKLFDKPLECKAQDVVFLRVLVLDLLFCRLKFLRGGGGRPQSAAAGIARRAAGGRDVGAGRAPGARPVPPQ